MTDKLDTQVILDSLGHGLLIFDSSGKLIQHNRMAGTILGTDLNLIRSDGWEMACGLFDANLQEDDKRADEVRAEALQSDRPVRFHIFRSGAYVPCWASAVTATDGDMYVLVMLDVPDWSFVRNVVDRFRSEMRLAVDSTIGHIQIINKSLKSASEDDATAKIGKRIGGFTRLIEIHMSRAVRLMEMLERLEDIRTNNIRKLVRSERRKINLEDFMEDFMEDLDEIELLDPETEIQDYRSRMTVEVPSGIAVLGVKRYLTYTLQELLRNAIMYSLRGTPIKVSVHSKERSVQFDITDEGYGIRQKERDRVFRPFERARQPQIISEFGYGLGLHLCKHEIEAMNGQIWFTSEEGVGTTMHFMLPLWRLDEATKVTSETSAVNAAQSSANASSSTSSTET